VRQGSLAEAGGHIRDARYPEHSGSHVICDDHFGHRRHAGRVGAESPEHLHLGRRLIGWPRKSGVHALGQRYSDCCCGAVGELAQRWGVGVRHVREARPELVVVVTAQRVLGEQIQVVADQHQRAWREAVADAAGRVGHDQRLCAESNQRARREGRVSKIVALVEMHAPLHGRALHALERTEHQLAGVALDARHRKVRNVAVVDGDGVLEAVGERAESAAQDQTDRRCAFGGTLADASDGGVDVLDQGVAHRMTSSISGWGSGRSSPMV
jgi:hypothetical protein